MLEGKKFSKITKNSLKLVKLTLLHLGNPQMLSQIIFFSAPIQTNLSNLFSFNLKVFLEVFLKLYY